MRKRRSSKVIPVLIVILAILLIGAGMFLYNRYSPSKEREDLMAYFDVQEAGDVPVIRDRVQMDWFGKEIDGHIYLPYQIVHDTINDRFYLDEEGLLLYARNDTELVYPVADGESRILINHYQSDGMTEESVDLSCAPMIQHNGEWYLSLEFVSQYGGLNYTFYEEPDRVILTTDFQPVTLVTVNKNTALRVKGGIKSPILTDLSAGDSVALMEEGEDWDRVHSADGITGYVEKKVLGEAREEAPLDAFPKEAFTHTLHDGKVSLVWHQVTNQDVNARISEVLSSVSGVNVISPTWFYLNDNEGGVADLASQAYVDYCHQRNIQVWGLVSNFESPDVDDEAILRSRTKRQHFISEMAAKAEAYGLDGINLDFELISEECGPSYVQLVREMSLVMKSKGLILSVDNTVPMSFSAHYDRGEQTEFADYMVMMGYDEHYSGSDEGSVASISFVETGIQDMLALGVPADRLILGMPFYTRIWEETPKTGVSDLEQASEDFIPYELTSRALGMEDQMSLINSHQAEIVWLEDCGQNYAEWVENGLTYKVWIEDLMSLEKRLQLIQTYGLAGGAFWKLELETPEVWGPIASYLQ